MHLICLGVVKKLISFWVKVSPRTCKIISTVIKSDFRDFIKFAKQYAK